MRFIKYSLSFLYIFAFLTILAFMIAANINYPKNIAGENNFKFFQEKADIFYYMHFNWLCDGDKAPGNYECMKAAHDANDYINKMIKVVRTTPEMDQEILAILTRSNQDYMSPKLIAIYKKLANQYADLLKPEAQKFGFKSVKEYWMLD